MLWRKCPYAKLVPKRTDNTIPHRYGKIEVGLNRRDKLKCGIGHKKTPQNITRT